MKNIIFAIVLTGIVVFIGYSCSDGLDREIRRQCIVAQDNCEKYSDAGACDPKYLKICEVVKDAE